MDAAEHRAARRAFIRANHPDAGGDPSRFAAGLRDWDDARATPPDGRFASPAIVHVFTRRAWPLRLLGVVTTVVTSRVRGHGDPRSARVL